MDFNKIKPKEQGYYFMTDINYPVCLIGYVGPLGRVYDQRLNEIPDIYVDKYIRFGDQIIFPKVNIIN